MAKISEVLLHQSGRQVRARGAANIAQDKDFALNDLKSWCWRCCMDSALIGPAATTGFIRAHAANVVRRVLFAQSLRRLILTTLRYYHRGQLAR